MKLSLLQSVFCFTFGLICMGATVEAAAPTMNSINPMGGQVGTTVTITVDGSVPKEGVGYWCSRNDLQLEPGEKPNQIKITIPDSALPGLAWLRLHNKEGASKLRPFMVGLIPEQNETESNNDTRLLSHSDVGFIGFGELGRAINKLLTGFQPNVSVFDPWLPASVLKEQGATPASLESVLRNSDFVFVTASVTSENEGFLSAGEFASMRPGSALILVSRAAVVNFDDLIDAVEAGHIVAATDVFPEEPLPPEHRGRRCLGMKLLIRNVMGS